MPPRPWMILALIFASVIAGGLIVAPYTIHRDCPAVADLTPVGWTEIACPRGVDLPERGMLVTGGDMILSVETRRCFRRIATPTACAPRAVDGTIVMEDPRVCSSATNK